jgi:hypothetical protein
MGGPPGDRDLVGGDTLTGDLDSRVVGAGFADQDRAGAGGLGLDQGGTAGGPLLVEDVRPIL